MRLLVGAAALICALAPACSVGPRYRRPDVATPPAFKEPPPPVADEWKLAHPNDGELKGKWWEMFGDPELNRLEEMAASTNQNVRQAEARFRQARELVALSRANYFPTVGASPAITSSQRGGSSTNSFNVPTSARGGSTTSTFLSLPFSVSWEPNLWGRLSLAAFNAIAGAQASAADLENVLLSMQAELAADYFLLLGADMDIALINDTITAYERALKLTRDRFNAGVASRADVLQAETQLSNARSQVLASAITRAQLEHAIAVLSGQPPENLSLAAGSISGPPPPVPAGIPSQLLERRPDIAGAERLVAAANAQIGLARVAYYPSVSLSGSFGFQSSGISNWLSWPARFWSVGPALAQTLLDFGRRGATVRESEAFYDSQVAAYRQAVLTGFQEVEDSLAALRLLEREAAEQQNAVASARQALQLETERLQGGNRFPT